MITGSLEEKAPRAPSLADDPFRSNRVPPTLIQLIQRNLPFWLKTKLEIIQAENLNNTVLDLEEVKKCLDELVELYSKNALPIQQNGKCLLITRILKGRNSLIINEQPIRRNKMTFNEIVEASLPGNLQ